MFFRRIPSYMRYRIGLGIVIVVIGLLAWQFFGSGSDKTTDAQISQTQRTIKAFANVPIGSLDATQRRILTTIKQEYTKEPKYYDKTVLKYTEGFKESWCADFITWVLNEADTPVKNSETDYWRIPGVVSLQQYYIDNKAYAAADSGYTPQLGDVVFYIGSQTPDNSSDEHAAFVLGVTADAKLITIGGNEADGILRIRTESLAANKAKGMVGYGKLYV